MKQQKQNSSTRKTIRNHLSVYSEIQEYFKTKKIKTNNIIELNKSQTPHLTHYAEGLRAGFPSPAEDFPVEKLSLDKLLIKKPSATFSIRVIGDSMIDAGIYEGDLAIVEKGHIPINGDIVVAAVDGDFTMKIYRKEKGFIYLEAANKAFPKIKAHNEIEIFGIVTGIIRQIKEF